MGPNNLIKNESNTNPNRQRRHLMTPPDTPDSENLPKFPSDNLKLVNINNYLVNVKIYLYGQDDADFNKVELNLEKAKSILENNFVSSGLGIQKNNLNNLLGGSQNSLGLGPVHQSQSNAASLQCLDTGFGSISPQNRGTYTKSRLPNSNSLSNPQEYRSSGNLTAGTGTVFHKSNIPTFQPLRNRKKSLDLNILKKEEEDKQKFLEVKDHKIKIQNNHHSRDKSFNSHNDLNLLDDELHHISLISDGDCSGTENDISSVTDISRRKSKSRDFQGKLTLSQHIARESAQENDVNDDDDDDLHLDYSEEDENADEIDRNQTPVPSASFIRQNTSDRLKNDLKNKEEELLAVKLKLQSKEIQLRRTSQELGKTTKVKKLLEHEVAKQLVVTKGLLERASQNLEYE